MRVLVIVFASLLVASCATSGSEIAAGSERPFAVEVRGDTVGYGGYISQDGFEELKRKTEGRHITTILIGSQGGDISAGIDFGYWVHENTLNVVVSNACLSSCANYIFPAGREKTIQAGAIVAWHGSARQRSFLEHLNVEQLLEDMRRAAKKENWAQTDEELQEKAEATRESLRELIKKQDGFFETIGVDEYVTRIGQEEYGARGFYAMSVADMERFGIHNVATEEADYAKTDLKAWRESVKWGGRVPVEFITLKRQVK